MTPPHLIFRAVALEYDVPESALTRKGASLTTARARRAAVFLLRADGRSFREVGRTVGMGSKGAWTVFTTQVQAIAADATVKRTLRRIVERVQLMQRGPIRALTVPR